MDRERLTELLQDPAQVAAGDLGDLRSMTERFPWFSGAHLLLAVGEHAQGDVLSNDPVRTPAAYLPSRAVLFDLTQAESAPARPAMHVVKDVQPKSPSPTPEPVETPPTVKIPVKSAESPASTAEEARPVVPDVPVTGKELAPSSPAVPPSASIREQPNAAPLQPDLAPPMVEGRPPIAEERGPVLLASGTGSVDAPPPSITPGSPMTATDPLDRQMREAIIASGYGLGRVTPSSLLTRAPVPTLEHTPVPSLPSWTASEAPIAQPARPASPITGKSRLRFTDWLTAGDEVSPESGVLPAPDPSTENAIAPLASGSLPAPQEIIDRFIQQATPAAAAVKAEFFTPQQAAKRSLQDEGLVSETLAKIYEQQGDITKAKAAYTRLAIIHPEKSIYFAALSKALEGRSNK